MFLLRTAFWLSLVVILLPADPRTGEQAPRVGAIEALSAARTAVGDLSAFCDRNPDVCATGNTAFAVLAQKVRYGADLIRDYFDGEPTNGQSGTLNRDDVQPVWQGPRQLDGTA